MGLKEKQQEMAEAIEEVLTLHNVQIDALAKKAAAEEGDFSAILEQAQARLDELSAKSEKMLKESGMTREQLDAYVANRANFSPEEWKMLEATKQTCQEMKEQSAHIIQNHMPKEVLEEMKKPKTPKLKKKKRIAKRKDWLQM